MFSSLLLSNASEIEDLEELEKLYFTFKFKFNNNNNNIWQYRLTTNADQPMTVMRLKYKS